MLFGALTLVSPQQGWLRLAFWSDHALQLPMMIEIVLWMFMLAMRVTQARASDAEALDIGQHMLAAIRQPILVLGTTARVGVTIG